MLVLLTSLHYIKADRYVTSIIIGILLYALQIILWQIYNLYQQKETVIEVVKPSITFQARSTNFDCVYYYKLGHSFGYFSTTFKQSGWIITEKILVFFLFKY